MMLPDELEWVLEMLGYRWPTADEDKLRESAQLWRKFGDDVTRLHSAANTSARTVTAHNAGESIDAFTKTYAKFDGGSGGDGYLSNAAQAAHIIANVMDACAYLVEFAKWAVIAQLIALAIEIAAAQVAAPFTFGLSEVAALGATQATRLIVRRLLDELKDALMEAIVEAMKEPAVSAIEAIITDLVRQSVNVGFGAQQGFDLSQTVKAGAQGGWEAIKQTPQTLAEGVRDSLGSKAGNRAHHAIDSRIDGYGNTSSEAPGSGGSGSDGSDSGSSGSSRSSDSSSSSGSSSSSDSSSSSGSSGSSGSDSSSSSTRSGIGSGISAETGGATVGAPDIGSGPGSGSTTDSGPSSSSSDTSYPRPAPSSTGPTLSDFDDPSPVAATTSTPDTGTAAGSSGTSHTGGGSSVSGLSSPTPHSAPTTSSGGSVSSSSGNGGISTNIDSLAASVPTQSAATPTPAAEPAPGSSGGRPDSGSAMPTSPTAPTTGAGTTGARPATHAPGASSTTGPTSPTTQTGPARTPSASAPATGSVPGNTTATGPNTSASGPARTPGAHNGAATGPASTPQSTPASTPRTSPSTPSTPNAPSTPSTSTPSTHTRTPGADGRTPGTPDNRTPGTTDNRTPGSTDSRTPHQTAPPTTPTGRTPAPSTPDGTGTHTPAGRQNPSTVTPQTPRTSPVTEQNPGQNTPAQSSPPRTAPPSTGTRTTTPPTNPDRTSAPSGRTAAHSPQPGPVTNAPTGTHNQPSATPTRPPHQPAGNATSAPGTPGTPRTPNTPQQPAAQPTPPQSTPPTQQQPRDNQVTAVPIPTALRTPAPAASPTQATPTAPQAPGSPTTPGSPTPAQQPQQDSLQDIRADLDHSPGGLTPPDPADQQALTDAVPHNEDGTPQRFPDPFGPWTGLQNDGGPTVPGRSNNCADCSRSFLETWYGNPQVSAPRTPDTDPNGNPDTWSPETDANDNQIRWTGSTHTYAGPGGDPGTAAAIADTLQQAGPGSAAIVQVDWPGGGGHAYNAVNHNGTIVWIDTQSGQVSHQPLHIDQAAHVWHIPLDPDRNPIDTTQPEAQDTAGTTETTHGAAGHAESTPSHTAQDDLANDTLEQGGESSPSETGVEDSSTGRSLPGRGVAPAEPSGGTLTTSADFPDPHDRGVSDTSAQSRDVTADGPESDTSRTHESPESPQSREYGIEPDTLQGRLREERDVHRVELDRVHHQLDRWTQSGELARVLHVTAGTQPHPDGPSGMRSFTQAQLSANLTGFDRLSPGEQQAVVASLARLSLSFHQQHGVGRSPEVVTHPYRQPDEPAPEPGTKDRGAKLSKQSLGLRLHRMAVNTLFRGAEFKKLPEDEAKTLKKNGPDFTDKNFAVLEVQGPPPDHEVMYVADSSVPANTPGVSPRHSERHLMQWLERIDPQGDRYTPVGLYTEREPCGEGKGHARCSEVLQDKRLEGVPVHYSATYRQDPEGVAIRAAMLPQKAAAVSAVDNLSDQQVKETLEDRVRNRLVPNSPALPKNLATIESLSPGEARARLKSEISNEQDSIRKATKTDAEKAMAAEMTRHMEKLGQVWEALRPQLVN
ncbi:hypothetical protein J7I94_21415 [Streptomyces sp. ISL-12]|uniref:toxin glutamine deamidase domain-containing protein n=1 Tax=Streptomyces sp. ISL-12 TaxID=2819177 RepID=UPI001BEC84AB|nr:toxin glutamine deamidase domain-containing protein [Streptomyces sp. ISL-12]MBT2413087.1 hypothetical protein [Streptomyces sp. ISL-12]